MRRVLTEIIKDSPDFEVVGAARDALTARDMIRALNPDVLTLNVEMPKFDGVAFLERLMRSHPTPVLMISSLTDRGSEATLRALELGAVDFIAKPKVDGARGLRDYAIEIHDKLRTVARARIKRHEPLAIAPAHKADVILALAPGRQFSTESLIVLGAST